MHTMAKSKRPHEEQTLLEGGETGAGIKDWVGGICNGNRSEDVDTFVQSTCIDGGRGHGA